MILIPHEVYDRLAVVGDAYSAVGDKFPVKSSRRGISCV